jgi:hypothetical protein
LNRTENSRITSVGKRLTVAAIVPRRNIRFPILYQILIEIGEELAEGLPGE